jgi:hypothetical protein
MNVVLNNKLPWIIGVEPDPLQPNEMALIQAVTTAHDRPNAVNQVGFLEDERSAIVLIGIGDIDDLADKFAALADVVMLSGGQTFHSDGRNRRKGDQN